MKTTYIKVCRRACPILLRIAILVTILLVASLFVSVQFNVHLGSSRVLSFAIKPFGVHGSMHTYGTRPQSVPQGIKISAADYEGEIGHPFYPAFKSRAYERSGIGGVIESHSVATYSIPFVAVISPLILIHFLCQLLVSRHPMTCHNCGYDLRGTPRSKACPECGSTAE